MISRNDAKLAREFSASYGIRLRRGKTLETECYLGRRLITLNAGETDTIEKLWSLLFHELSHFRFQENGWFNWYHSENLEWLNSAEFAKQIRSEGLYVENVVDMEAKKLMHAYLPGIPFTETYASEENQAWYKAYVDKMFPLKDENL